MTTCSSHGFFVCSVQFNRVSGHSLSTQCLQTLAIMPLSEGCEGGPSSAPTVGIMHHLNSRIRTSNSPIAAECLRNKMSIELSRNSAAPSETQKNVQSFLQAARPHSSSEWDKMKDTIQHLYLDLDMPLEEVVEVLSRENNFHTK